MKLIDLDNRLKTVSDYIHQDATVADIGTDHAFLAVYLIQNNKAKSVIAADIGELPLASAKRTIEHFGLQEKVTLRLSNGLEKFKSDEFDTLVIAGMGGELISSILMNSPFAFDSNKHFILQPMSRADYLREFLLKNNFQIIDETAVFANNKVYTVISAKKGQPNLEINLTNLNLGLLKNKTDNNTIKYKQKVLVGLSKKLIGLKKAEDESVFEYEKIIANLKTELNFTN